MLRFIIVLLANLLVLAGCSAALVPQPQGDYRLDNRNQSLSAERDGLVISAAIADFEVAPYRITDNLCSFSLTVQNRTGQPTTLAVDRLILIDQDGRQYRPLKPAAVVELTRRDSAYLIPYPYVGYYYLQDREHFSFDNSLTSNAPFYAENHPQDIFIQALPQGKILPDATVAGMVYFAVDLSAMTEAELRIYSSAKMVDPPQFSFRFAAP